MARGINKVILIGNLGKDPELRSFPNGGQICNATLATSESWKDRQTGEMKEATEWHNIVFNDKLAEIVSKYLRKGSKIYVEGSLRTRKWQSKEGQDRYTTEIRVSEMQMLDGKGSAPGSTVSDAEYGSPAPRFSGFKEPAAVPQTSSVSMTDNFEDDDIPF